MSSIDTASADADAHMGTPNSEIQVTNNFFPPQRLSTERLVHKLTVKLITTYRNVNEAYYREKREKKQKAVADNKDLGDEEYTDQNFDYIVTEGECIGNSTVGERRYKLVKVIGKGSFGQVVRAFDTKTNEEVAIKIIKGRKAFLMQARTEVKILEFLNKHDWMGQSCVVRMKETFLYRRHQCIVFELLSRNLYDLLRHTRFQGVSLDLVRKFARQILRCLDFLSSPNINVVHCDLKPENILLVDKTRATLRVIDFGSSCFATEPVFTYIQSRFYRSPEVLLGCPYDTRIDMWSLGCILVELHTGEPLFNGRTEVDQLYKIMAVLGWPPPRMLVDGKRVSRFFSPDPENAGKWLSRATEPVPKRSLEEIITKPPARESSSSRTVSECEYLRFVDVVTRMLAIDPAERITPAEAMEHSFFRSVQDVGTLTEPGGYPTEATAIPASGAESDASQPQPSGAGEAMSVETVPAVLEASSAPDAAAVSQGAASSSAATVGSALAVGSAILDAGDSQAASEIGGGQTEDSHMGGVGARMLSTSSQTHHSVPDSASGSQPAPAQRPQQHTHEEQRGTKLQEDARMLSSTASPAAPDTQASGAGSSSSSRMSARLSHIHKLWPFSAKSGGSNGSDVASSSPAETGPSEAGGSMDGAAGDAASDAHN
eukprot:Rmarinus@m.19088